MAGENESGRAPVAACSFFRSGCGGQDHVLYRREYARSNNKRGTKILRCFPHCCPDHVPRSYCGCSLKLQVTFSDTSIGDHENLLVCARFEPAASSGELWGRMGLGETVALPTSALRLCTGMHSDWVHAEQTNDTIQHPVPENARVYVLNNHRFPKWYYSYEGGYTKTQREMQHHLVAYVFRLLPMPGERYIDADEEPRSRGSPQIRMGTVLWRQPSPAFRIVSYRRSNDRRRAERGRQVCRSHGANDETETELGVMPSGENDNPNESVEVNEEEFAPRGLRRPPQESDHCRTEIRGSTMEPLRIDSEVPSTPGPGRVDSLDTRGVTEKAQHLLILHTFLSLIPLKTGGYCLDVLDEAVRAEVRSTFAVNSSNHHEYSRGSRHTDAVHVVVDSASAAWLNQLAVGYSLRSTFAALGGGDTDAWLHDKDQVLVRTCMGLVLDAMNSDKMQELLRSAFAGRNLPCSETSGKQLLTEWFTPLITEIYDDFVRIASARGTAVPTLIDDIGSLMYTNERLRPQRRLFSRLLLRPGLALVVCGRRALREFAACRCEVAPVHQHTAHPSEHSRAGTPTAAPEIRSHWEVLALARCRPWNRRWLLEPDSVRMSKPSSGGTRALPFVPSSAAEHCSVSFLNAVCWLHQLVCIDIQLDGATCSIRSVFPHATLPLEMGKAMVLELDGQPHKLFVLPNGVSPTVSTSWDPWTVRDYSGCVSASRRSIQMQLNAFEEDSVLSAIAEDDDRHTGGSTSEPKQIRRLCVTLTREVQLLSARVFPLSTDHRLFVQATLERASRAWGHEDDRPGVLRGTAAASGHPDRREAFVWETELELEASYSGLS